MDEHENAAPSKPLPPEQNFDIHIRADAVWLHEGRPINRMALVKLFASVLRRDDAGDYWLQTPVERGRITVEDAPFAIVEVWRDDAEICARTNLDAVIRIGDAHLLRMETAKDGPRAYIEVSPRLDGRLTRSAYYDLVALATTQDGVVSLESGGRHFVLGTVE